MAHSNPENVFNVAKLMDLQPRRHLELLNVIDRLRAQGLHEHVDLPQLIVCGDQSSGKSSVLAAISGIPFPKKENLCTRFATEVVLRRDDDLDSAQISVSITPSSTRTSAERSTMQSFKRDLSSIDLLSQTLDDAAVAMGLGTSGSAFSADILRLEVRGPQMPQLTIVDLPGLIHSENKLQSKEDVGLVSKLVHDYMLQERSVILAVISAKNDYANQIVLSKARKVDPDGRRTLGIITKPDTLHPGSTSETTFISLAQNQDVKFNLGWHVVRNQDSNELADSDRDQAEAQFFETSTWASFDPRQCGIQALRERLSAVLFEQIQKELPGLITEIVKMTASTEVELARMGRSRSTSTEKQLFVVELGQKYSELCYASCEAIYDHVFFAEHESADTSSRRLRALVSNRHLEFAKQMSLEPLQIIGAAPAASTNADAVNDNLVKRARTLLNSYRGKELPGTYNPSLIGQLFRELSRKWVALTREHAESIWLYARTAVLAILDEITEESVKDTCVELIVDPQLQETQKVLQQRLNDYMQEFQRHPITLNHYLTETVQNIRRGRRNRVAMQRYHKLFESRDCLYSSDMDLIISAMASSNEPDMDEVAAQDLADYAYAFYKVALKRVIDEIPAHVIEPVVLSPLPKLFAPNKVLMMPNDTIDRIGGESAAKSAHRDALQRKLSILNSSSIICRLYSETTASAAPAITESPSSTSTNDGSLFDHVKLDSPSDVQPQHLEFEQPVQEDIEVVPSYVLPSKKKKKVKRVVAETAPVPELSEDQW